MGAMQVLKEQNISIPDQVALVGFSNEPFTLFTEPALTTINQFPLAMGRSAANLFFNALDNTQEHKIPQQQMLSPELIVRASSLKIIDNIK